MSTDGTENYYMIFWGGYTEIRHGVVHGNGAHASYLLAEAQLDAHIKAFTTLYLYVTGMCFNELKDKYDI